MNKLSYYELLQQYDVAKQTIIEMQEELENKDWKIELLQTNITEPEDILYTNGIFKHFD